MARSTSSTPEGRAEPDLAIPHSSHFVTTHWSAVLNAGRCDSPEAQDALARLCQGYWFPLYAFARRQGSSPHDAQDFTQEFFAQLLRQKTLAQADPERGRFRSFLLASFKHFLAHEWEKARAQKRGGQVQFIPLEIDTAETRYAAGPATEDTPDRAFDRQWALALLDAVLGRVRQEYVNAGRQELFLVLKETLSAGRADTPYRELAQRLGVSESAIKMAAHRMRVRYREVLREEISNTVAEPGAVDQELRDLFTALG